MALELKSKVTSIIDQFNLFDKTGVYHVTDNPTGYGIPNVEISDIYNASVSIKMPNGDVVSLPIYAGGTIDTLPSDSLISYFEITNTLVGVDKFELGYYEITYIINVNINDDIDVYEEQTSKNCLLYYAPVECCLDKKVLALDDCSTAQEIDEVATYKALFEGMKAKARVGKKKEALAILKYLETKCDCCC
jgi:hypothetical protein